MATADKIISRMSGRKLSDRKLNGIAFDSFKLSDEYGSFSAVNHDLGVIGMHLGSNQNRAERNIREMMKYAMDDVQSPITTPSIITPVQFLQHWMPGFVHVMTAARRADELMGLSIMGSWFQEQIVQGIIEHLGVALPYNDYQNTPFSGTNANFIYRTIIRFTMGMRVGVKEELTTAEANIAIANEKRTSAANNLEIARNLIGMFGYNNGDNFTYGYLNEPNLSAYDSVAFPNWTMATFLEIQSDLLTQITRLREQSRDMIDPSSIRMTLALSTNRVDTLSTTSDFGISVREWLAKTYPLIRVISAPELDLANGGENVGYLYAEELTDSSTDGGQTWLHACPTKFTMLGVARYETYYSEAYLNATAGAMLKRPVAVVRFTGI